MDNFEPKKLLILRILEILNEYSDCDHKLRQGDIISLLRVQYGIECERKAVARNIKASLIASPRAMRFWILQFGKYVKVLSRNHSSIK